ncbi:hypothetical protein [Leuconostoc citreum]|uniref:hypothetical protein n=1 Tax=Leuconostoc citreum TaxID=33964 RepID=UPI0032DF9DE9
MLLKTYINIYQKDDHKANDALPQPTLAQKLSVELNKIYKPTTGEIRTQALLADRYGMSVAALLRFQTLMLDHNHFKYLPIVEKLDKKPANKTKQYHR